MKYQFALGGKAIVGFGLGLGLAAALVFADGMLVGMGLYRHSAVPLLLASQKAADSRAVTAANAASAKPAVAAVASPAAPAAAVPVAAQTSAGAPASACGVAPAAAASVGAEFALQLGSFEDPANAAKLATSLSSRGCTAVVTQFTDASHHVWNVVRIGPYDSLQDAVRAAAEMRRTQGLLALVRPGQSI